MQQAPAECPGPILVGHKVPIYVPAALPIARNRTPAPSSAPTKVMEAAGPHDPGAAPSPALIAEVLRGPAGPWGQAELLRPALLRRRR